MLAQRGEHTWPRVPFFFGGRCALFGLCAACSSFLPARPKTTKVFAAESSSALARLPLMLSPKSIGQPTRNARTDAPAAAPVADGAAGLGPDGRQRLRVRGGVGPLQPLGRAQGGLHPLRGAGDGNRVVLAEPVQPAGEQGHVAVNPEHHGQRQAGVWVACWWFGSRPVVLVACWLVSFGVSPPAFMVAPLFLVAPLFRLPRFCYCPALETACVLRDVHVSEAQAFLTRGTLVRRALVVVRCFFCSHLVETDQTEHQALNSAAGNTFVVLERHVTPP